MPIQQLRLSFQQLPHSSSSPFLCPQANPNAMGLFECVGHGITMGSSGLRWPGTGEDCVMLWTGAFGITSGWRSLLATLLVGLMAMLAQYLTALSGQKLQTAKQIAKRKRLSSLLGGHESDMEQARSSLNGEDKTLAKPLVAAVAVPSSTHQVQQHPATAQRSSAVSSSSTPVSAAAFFSPSSLVQVPKVSNLAHFGDSLLHGLRMFVAYLLMLAVMTYDLALFASIVAGFTLGYYHFTTDTSKVPISADPCCS